MVRPLGAQPDGVRKRRHTPRRDGARNRRSGERNRAPNGPGRPNRRTGRSRRSPDRAGHGSQGMSISVTESAGAAGNGAPTPPCPQRVPSRPERGGEERDAAWRPQRSRRRGRGGRRMVSRPFVQRARPPVVTRDRPTVRPRGACERTGTTARDRPTASRLPAHPPPWRSCAISRATFSR